MRNKDIILGAGITGLSVGMETDSEIYEAKELSGGICASYYISSEGEKLYSREDKNTYRFELGGGHWIFGAGDYVLNSINKLSPVKSYERNSAVYFPDRELYVPYPLQNNLSYLPNNIAKRALNEMLKSDNKKEVSTLADWLEMHFGKTLCEYFFFPFHELYTAGLYTKIEPQDKYKTPMSKKHIIQGFNGETPPVGYNKAFVYPKKGLDDLMRKMVKRCNVNYNKKLTRIDVKNRKIILRDGTEREYETLFSTLPLNKTIEKTRINIEEPEPPYTSVLVINIGAKKGIKCPNYHWLYLPKSKSGFHRVGFYSNVDESFLPKYSRKNNDRVSIYVEKAYRPEEKPRDEEIESLCSEVVKELQDWQFIDKPEVKDPTWIEVAYTWSWPDSKWRPKAIKELRLHNIYPIGRYGLWKFQGIAESIKDGLEVRYEKRKK